MESLRNGALYPSRAGSRGDGRRGPAPAGEHGREHRDRQAEGEREEPAGRRGPSEVEPLIGVAGDEERGPVRGMGEPGGAAERRLRLAQGLADRPSRVDPAGVEQARAVYELEAPR
jgi:hypothetical protein